MKSIVLVRMDGAACWRGLLTLTVVFLSYWNIHRSVYVIRSEGPFCEAWPGLVDFSNCTFVQVHVWQGWVQPTIQIVKSPICLCRTGTQECVADHLWETLMKQGTLVPSFELDPRSMQGQQWKEVEQDRLIAYHATGIIARDRDTRMCYATEQAIWCLPRMQFHHYLLALNGDGGCVPLSAVH